MQLLDCLKSRTEWGVSLEIAKGANSYLDRLCLVLYKSIDNGPKASFPMDFVINEPCTNAEMYGRELREHK